MTNMRTIINLLNEGVLDTTHDVEMDQSEADHTANDGERLQGAFLNPDQVAEYFPSIVDNAAFNRAWRKIIQNKEENLTRNEAWELGRAFIDLVRMENADKLSFLRRILLVGAGEDQRNQGIKLVYR